MMFKTNSYNTTSGSFMNESACAASSSSARLSLDTVIAVSIFALLAIILSLVIEVSVIILAVVSVVIALVILAAVIIEGESFDRPVQVKG